MSRHSVEDRITICVIYIIRDPVVGYHRFYRYQSDVGDSGYTATLRYLTFLYLCCHENLKNHPRTTASRRQPTIILRYLPQPLRSCMYTR
jgi:hypothetical protein